MEGNKKGKRRRKRERGEKREMGRLREEEMIRKMQGREVLQRRIRGKVIFRRYRITPENVQGNRAETIDLQHRGNGGDRGREHGKSK